MSNLDTIIWLQKGQRLQTFTLHFSLDSSSSYFATSSLYHAKLRTDSRRKCWITNHWPERIETVHILIVVTAQGKLVLRSSFVLIPPCSFLFWCAEAAHLPPHPRSYNRCLSSPNTACTLLLLQALLVPIRPPCCCRHAAEYIVPSV